MEGAGTGMQGRGVVTCQNETIRAVAEIISCSRSARVHSLHEQNLFFDQVANLLLNLSVLRLVRGCTCGK